MKTKRNIENRLCEYCWNTFYPQGERNKFCSPYCRDKHAAIKGKEKAREYRQTITGRLNNLRGRCKADNIPFELEKHHVKIPKVCPILRIPLNNKDRNHQWSFDRIDPSKGYIPGNVQIISMRANRLKNDASLDELEKIVEYMRKHLPKTKNAAPYKAPTGTETLNHLLELLSDNNDLT